MSVVIDASVPSLTKRFRRHNGFVVTTRVGLGSTSPQDSFVAVAAAMEMDSDASGRWRAYPTANGTTLQVTGALLAAQVLDRLADRLTAQGYVGSISANILQSEDLFSRRLDSPLPPSAVLAYTLEAAYEQGPFNKAGVVKSRWGLSAALTQSLVQDWIQWIIDPSGSAGIGPPGVDLTSVDAADVLISVLDDLKQTATMVGQPSGTAATRTLRAQKFGEVLLTEYGTGMPRSIQAQHLLERRLLPQAANVDYATLRIHTALTSDWSAPADRSFYWRFRVRHLWSRFVPDANGIQILTDSHLDKARDLSANWDVTELSPGRWLVQAKDLGPWYDDIDDESARMEADYVDVDVLRQARHDFGDMIITPEVAHAHEVRP